MSSSLQSLPSSAVSYPPATQYDPRLSCDGYGNGRMPVSHTSALPNQLPNFGLNGMTGGFFERPMVPELGPQDVDRIASQVTELTDQNTQLRKDVKFLKKELLETRKELSTGLGNILDMLKENSRVSTTPNTTDVLPIPIESEEDHPLIKFWTAKLFRTEKKARKGLTGLHQVDTSGNTMTWYVETDDGDPVDSETVEAIRSFARTIWQELLHRGIAPTTWAEAGLVALNYFEHHMCRRFPQLSYGENNWKCQMIGTDNYSSWYNKHVGRSTKIKTEEAAKNEAKPVDGVSKKRLAPLSDNNGMGIETKRARNEDSLMGEKGLTQPIVLKNSLDTVFSDPCDVAKLVPPSIAPPTPITSPTTQSSAPNTTQPASDTTQSAPATTAPSAPETTQPTPETTPSALDTSTSTSTIECSSSPGATAALAQPSRILNAAKVPKAKKAKVGQAMNAKSICKRAWVKQHPTGTDPEFALYWNSLGLHGQKEFEIQAKEAKSQLP
ncbi:hypothetical protein C0991_000547, partial [Blastosporella zonata]